MTTSRTLRLAPLALAAALVACTPSSDEGGAKKIGGAPPPKKPAAGKVTIQDTGSDTMVNLAQTWAEAYQKVKPSVAVQVAGGGSGVGIAALEAGTVDIANASREIKPAEAQKVKAKSGKDPKETPVAYDCLAVYVNKNNPMETISMEELAEIYGENGKFNKWSDLGVKIPGLANDEIQRVSRQSSSGTYLYFREAVVGEKREYKQGAMEMNGSKDIVQLVGNTPGAIGYSGMGYKDDTVKWLKVSKKKGEPGVTPSIAAVLDKSYPIARKLYMYTIGEATGEIKGYIDWILSPAGQKIVEEQGYVPLPM
jgi:phosphate transport system substrate-binding protein